MNDESLENGLTNKYLHRLTVVKTVSLYGIGVLAIFAAEAGFLYAGYLLLWQTAGVLFNGFNWKLLPGALVLIVGFITASVLLIIHSSELFDRARSLGASVDGSDPATTTVRYDKRSSAKTSYILGRLSMRLSMLMLIAVVAGISGRVRDTISTGREMDGLQDAVNKIKTGQIKPDKDGTIILPRTLGWLTINGRAYCSAQPGEPVALFFPIQQNHGNRSGYVYCDVSIPKIKDWHDQIRFPDDRSPVSNGLGSFNLFVDKLDSRAYPHWYYGAPFDDD